MSPMRAHGGGQYLALAEGRCPSLVVHAHKRAAARPVAAAGAAMVPSQGGSKPGGCDVGLPCKLTGGGHVSHPSVLHNCGRKSAGERYISTDCGLRPRN